MKRNPWILAVLLALAGASPSKAAFLTLTTNENLTWSSLADPSPTFTVGIGNSNPSQSGLLFGWSLGLKIVAENGATGSIQFLTATIPTSNYILNNDSLGLTPALTLPSATIQTISDVNMNGTGVSVATSGDNLLSLTFKASTGTTGVFQIEAIGDGITGSNWFSSDFMAQDYANVPFNTPGVVLGTVTIPAAMGAVPEPSTALLVLLAAGPMAWLARRSRTGLARSSA